MRCALVNPVTNAVENTILADPAIDPAPEGYTMVAADDAVAIGWLWQNGVFVNPNPPPPPPPAAVPEGITRRQCALQLFSIGMISAPEAVSMTQSGIPPAGIQQYFDTMPEPSRSLALIDFAAANYYRVNPLINALMTANNMTPEQIDQFFIAAAAL